MSLFFLRVNHQFFSILGKFSRLPLVNELFKFIKWSLIIKPVPLYSVPLFWIAALTPLFIALILAWPLMDGLSLKLSHDSYDFFVEKFKFPLWVASGAIILSVVIGRFHGSKQRHQAIMQTEENNSFSNYIDHRNLFNEIVAKGKGTVIFNVIPLKSGSKVTEEKWDIIIDTDILYRFLFPKNSHVKFDTTLVDISDIPELYYAYQTLHRHPVNRASATSKLDNLMVDKLGIVCISQNVVPKYEDGTSLDRSLAIIDYLFNRVSFIAKNNNDWISELFVSKSKRENIFLVKKIIIENHDKIN